MARDGEKYKVASFKTLDTKPNIDGKSSGKFEKLGWKIVKGPAP
jgi:hypothetical protein